MDLWYSIGKQDFCLQLLSTKRFEEMAGTDYDVTAAKAEFYATRGGVRGLVESGSDVVAAVPPLFLVPNSPVASATMTVPTVDLSLPRPAAVELIGAAARSGGLFYVTNHGVTVDSALSAIKAFHELPLAVRSPIYSVAPVAGVLYTTMQPAASAPAAAIPWRDTLLISLVGPHGAPPDLGRLPSECRDTLTEYGHAVSELGKKELAGLLSEALGLSVGAAVPPSVEASTMVCHYYLPCPEPTRVMGSMDHTDPSMFTVLAQDHVGGLMATRPGSMCRRCSARFSSTSATCSRWSQMVPTRV